ncbi:TadE/TadG family type IV pilus assembly protein [Brevundimonas sp.]|uniref:TadE/TadG family type IV pilus assembly protein n=1 Tax=Brevundimonas sp. TaxID=1871086 RepID=UPI003BAC9261
MNTRRPPVCFHSCRRGSAAVEFAFVGPMLILLLMGMVVYGGWFWLAQSVQSLASDSARAAMGGLDGTERRALATAFVADQARVGAGLDPTLIAVTVDSDAKAIRVSLAYDAHAHPILMLAGPLPKPPSLIRRTAVVRVGGY